MPEASAEESPEESSETMEIPVSMLGGQSVSPGDVIRLEVVASDEGSGVVKVKYAESKSDESQEMGIDGAAAKFEE